MLSVIEHGAVHELRLDRPPVNALSPELIAELEAAVRRAPEAGARAIVLSGRQGLFSAGLDVPCFLTLDREALGAAWRSFFDLMAALALAPVPVAAALTGHAPAGGCVLALMCHWRVLARGSFGIGLNEVAVGVRVPLPILAAAEHAVGRRQAERMCTTAVVMEGEEAARIGLVDELVEPADVVSRAIAWAEGQIALPERTLRGTRRLARRDLAQAFEAMDEVELECFLDEWFSAEGQGALRTLVERLAAKKR